MSQVQKRRLCFPINTSPTSRQKCHLLTSFWEQCCQKFPIFLQEITIVSAELVTKSKNYDIFDLWQCWSWRWIYILRKNWYTVFNALESQFHRNTSRQITPVWQGCDTGRPSGNYVAVSNLLPSYRLIKCIYQRLLCTLCEFNLIEFKLQLFKGVVHTLKFLYIISQTVISTTVIVFCSPYTETTLIAK